MNTQFSKEFGVIPEADIDLLSDVVGFKSADDILRLSKEYYNNLILKGYTEQLAEDMTDGYEQALLEILNNYKTNFNIK